MKKTVGTIDTRSKNHLIVTAYLGAIMSGLPLVVTNGYYNITETKSVYFYIFSSALLMFTAVYFLTDIIKTKNYKKDFILTDIPVAVFGFVVFLSAALSEYQSDVWFGKSSRYQGAVTVLIYILVYFAVSRNFTFSPSFLWCSLIAFSLVCVVGFLNCFDVDVLGIYSSMASKYKDAYISTIGNINFYSGYISLLFPVLICGFCQTKGRSSQIIYIASLIVGSLGMMVTSSESFVVGFCFSLCVIPLLFRNDALKLKKFLVSLAVIVFSSQVFLLLYNSADKKNIEISQLLSYFTNPVVSVMLILVCTAAYFLLCKKPEHINVYMKIYAGVFYAFLLSIVACFVLSNTVGLGALDKIFLITDKWGTYRGEIWKQCIEVYVNLPFDKKLFGIGPEALYRVVEASDIHGARVLDQAHNEYLQYLLTTGFFGLVLYLSVIVSVSVAVIRKLKHNTLAIGLLAGLVSYWIQATVNIAQPFTTPVMYVFISCIAGMLYNEKKNSASQHC